MTFTKQDAQDDAKLKNELAPHMMQQGRKANPQMWDAFTNVCDEMGLDPGVELASMFVRALDTQDFADAVAEQEVSDKILSTGEFRMEDAQMVKEFAEQFDLMPKSNDSDFLDDFIKQRIKAQTGTPFSKMRDGDGDSGGSNPDTEELKRKIDELQAEIVRQKESEEGSDTIAEQPQEQEEEDIDALFGGGVEEDEQEEEDGIIEEPSVSAVDVEVSEESEIEEDVEEVETDDGSGTEQGQDYEDVTMEGLGANFEPDPDSLDETDQESDEVEGGDDDE